MARKLVVEIVGDSRSLERSFARSTKASKQFEGTVKGMTRGLGSAFAALGVTLGAAGVVSGIKQSIDAASGLNEEVNKSEVIFGKSEQAILAWSKTTANAFGISQREALAAASNFGGLFEQIGKGRGEAASMSRDFVELAGDLASFFNVSTSDALDKLRSGLAGEAEPLRRFNVFIDEAKVKAEAYRSGIAKAGATLTQAQKLQARYNIIMRDTGPAHGDAARTADSFANVQRRLSALLEQTAATIGQALLPDLTRLADRMSDWLGDTRNQREIQERVNNAVKTATGVVKGLASVLRGINAILGPVVKGLGGVENAVKLIGIAWAGAKIGGMAGSLRGVGTGADAAAGKKGGKTGLYGLEGAALAAGYALGNLAVEHIPHAESALRGLGGLFFDKVVEPIGRGTGLIESDAERIAAAMERIGQAQALRAEGFGAREGPEGGFPRFDSEDRKRRRRTGRPGATGTTAAERAEAARRAAVRIAGVDAKLARQLDRVQDLPLRKQAARLKQIAAEIRARLALTKDATRRNTLEDQLVGIYREQAAVTATIAANAKAATDAAREAARLRKQTALFRQLGFGPGGEDLVPGVQALKKRLARTAQAVAQSPLAAKFRKQIQSIRKVLADEFTKTDKDLRDRLEQMLVAIDDKLKEHGEQRGRRRAFNANAMLAGLGLSPDQIRALRGRLSQLGPGGTRPGTGVGAFGIVIHHQTVVDGKVVESSVTKRQQTRRRRNPPQKRGPQVRTA